MSMFVLVMNLIYYYIDFKGIWLVCRYGNIKYIDILLLSSLANNSFEIMNQRFSIIIDSQLFSDHVFLLTAINSIFLLSLVNHIIRDISLSEPKEKKINKSQFFKSMDQFLGNSVI